MILQNENNERIKEELKKLNFNNPLLYYTDEDIAKAMKEHHEYIMRMRYGLVP